MNFHRRLLRLRICAGQDHKCIGCVSVASLRSLHDLSILSFSFSLYYGMCHLQISIKYTMPQERTKILKKVCYYQIFFYYLFILCDIFVKIYFDTHILHHCRGPTCLASSTNDELSTRVQRLSVLVMNTYLILKVINTDSTPTAN